MFAVLSWSGGGRVLGAPGWCLRARWSARGADWYFRVMSSRVRTCAAWGLCLAIAACNGDAGVETEGTDTAGATTGAETAGSAGTETASDSATDTTTASSGESSSTGAAPPIDLTSLEVAQTHILPGGEKRWTLANGEHSLHVVGLRPFLALVRLGDVALESPVLEAWFEGERVASAPLAPPEELLPTEAGGPAYAEDLYSATIDGAWVKPGLSLRVAAEGYAASDPVDLPIGAETDLDMQILPFYLFGANDENSPPISETATPDEESQAELYEKWPIARINFAQHAVGRVDWPSIIVGPRNGEPAMRVDNKDEQKDGFAVMSAVLQVLGTLRRANGETGTNSQIYAPLMMLDGGGEYSSPGGGLGGGSVGTGDHVYAGIFIHEQGHAFGMPHAADGYADGVYPYVGGSLLGSTWGLDASRGELLAPFIPEGAAHAGTCLRDGAHQIDAMNRCVKQDLMQSGAGDQAPGYKYTMHSDFNASVIQRYFEGVTSVDEEGVHVYEGGVIFVDPASSTGYSRWDSVDQERVEVALETVDKGLYGLDRGLPAARGVPVHTVIFTLSAAATPEVSQIYPPFSYVGNLVRQIDPTAAEELALITPNTGEIPWYCHASGCDYTLRVTYADQTIRHVLLRGGFRPWFGPMEEPEAKTLDPVDGASFRSFGVNVPGDVELSLVEVLHTPMGWGGVADDAEVVLSLSP